MLTLALPMAVTQIIETQAEPGGAAMLAWTRTAGRWPPVIDTNPTPGSCGCLREPGRKIEIWTRGSGIVCEVTAVSTGASAGLTL